MKKNTSSKMNTEKTDISQDFQSTVFPGMIRRRILVIIAHILVFAFALMLSFLMTTNMQFRLDWLVGQYPLMLAGILIIKMAVFGHFKQYKGFWRYVGIYDLIDIFKTTLISTLVIVVLWYVLMNAQSVRLRFHSLTEVSQGIFMLDMFFTFVLLGGLRMATRLYFEEFSATQTGKLKRLLIVGAGNAGEALLREIQRMTDQQYDVVGFIDDNPSKSDISIHGVPVMGNVEMLNDICEKNDINEIAIAMPSADHKQLRRVIQICQGTKLRFRTVPSITDIATGKFKVSQIRDVDINDLLGREAVRLDLDLIENFIRDKVILVTGAGGSIGLEMCRQVAQFKPEKLLLVEQAENFLFFIERELIKSFPDTNIVPLICDITDKARVEQIFHRYHPQVVIHAAAHKHVPMMEVNPCEAIKNNVVGSKTIANAADKFDSESFVMISTDKAVNPTSIMGSSKRIAEMYIQDLNITSKTNFVTVRFGNVLGSNGSVIPIFKNQIAQGGPVTVTHPDMTRYFMTIPEASQLVLQTATMGQGGEIFVLDMGEPVKIVDLARELITLSGFKPNEEIEIEFTGTRPGEKLFEELSLKGEDMMPTRHEKIGIWKNKTINRVELRQGIDELVEIAKLGKDHDQIVNGIKALIPEYIGDKQNHVNPQLKNNKEAQNA